MCRALVEGQRDVKIFTSGTISQPRHPSVRKAEKAQFKIKPRTCDHSAGVVIIQTFDGYTKHEIADEELKCERD